MSKGRRAVILEDENERFITGNDGNNNTANGPLATVSGAQFPLLLKNIRLQLINPWYPVEIGLLWSFACYCRNSCLNLLVIYGWLTFVFLFYSTEWVLEMLSLLLLEVCESLSIWYSYILSRRGSYLFYQVTYHVTN